LPSFSGSDNLAYSTANNATDNANSSNGDDSPRPCSIGRRENTLETTA
jgi:hypothetical protein